MNVRGQGYHFVSCAHTTHIHVVICNNIFFLCRQSENLYACLFASEIMATGDLTNNLRKLQKELKLIKFSENVDLTG